VNNIESLTGASDAWRDAIDVVSGIMEICEDAESVEVIELDVNSEAKTSVGKSPEIASLVPEALELRGRYGIPFWMSIMFVAQKTHVQIPKSVIRAANFHRSMPMRKIELKVDSSLSQNLRDVGQSLEGGRVLVLRSCVRMRADDEILHIPMLDFRLSSSDESHRTVMSVIREVGIPGALLNSGQSYHFYGFELMTTRQLHAFLGRALLFTPLIDYRWIAHQLIESTCALRISQGASGQIMPQLVDIVS
jgi:hypothetical protein